MKLYWPYRLTWCHYNKKSISRNAIFRHYNSVVLLEVLYTAETAVINGTTNINGIQKHERKILRKIYGAVCKDEK